MFFYWYLERSVNPKEYLGHGVTGAHVVVRGDTNIPALAFLNFVHII
jgi:hypothetical protein